MDLYETDAMSRIDIRNYACQLRKAFDVEGKLYFPVCEILEIFPQICPECTVEICEDTELDECTHATTDITNKVIKIKQSVYDGAVSGNGRDRATVLHEICHYLLLVINSMSLTRKFTKKKLPAYKDPEWQAKALAGELMMPQNLIKDFSVSEIVEKCGVSFESASFHYGLIHNK